VDNDKDRVLVLIIYRVLLALLTALRHRFPYLPDHHDVTIIISDAEIKD
jgi:hypothetical protein